MSGNQQIIDENIVTGATGIIGSHVVLKLLQDGFAVQAVRRKGSDVSKVERLFNYYSAGHLFSSISWIEADVTDVFSIESILSERSVVYHCAGLVSFNKKNRDVLFNINEKGTRNVVDACLYKKVKALCHVSTIGTVNNTDYLLPLNEKVFWKTSGKESDYALSKYNAEREVWRGMEEGLNAVIVNPGVVLSPGFWDQSSSRIFGSCYRGNKFYTPGITAYVAASDVASVMTALVNKRLFANRYIVVEDNYYFKEVFDMIHTKFKKPLPSIKASKALLKFGKVVESLITFFTRKDRLLSSALINAAFNKQTFSNQKVKEALNFEFRPIKKVIEEVADHYLSDVSKQHTSV